MMDRDVFRKLFVDNLKPINDMDLMASYIMDYFTIEIPKVLGAPLYEKKPYLFMIPEFVGGSNITPNTAYNRITSFGSTFIMRSPTIKEEDLCTMNTYYDDIVITGSNGDNVSAAAHPMLATAIRDRYAQEPGNFGSEEEMFSCMLLDLLHKMIPYMYRRFIEDIKKKFNIDPNNSNISIALYKSFNINNTELYRVTGMINHLHPYIRLVNGTGTYYDSSSAVANHGYSGNRITSGTAFKSFVMFPLTMDMALCDYIIPIPYYKYKNDPFELIAPDNNTDYHTKHMGNHLLDCMLYGYIRRRYIVGNLLNNLYINIIDNSNNSCYLIEYNRTGNKKKIIDTILNLNEVIRFNKKHQVTLISNDIQEEMTHVKSDIKNLEKSINNDIIAGINDLSRDCNRYLDEEITTNPKIIYSEPMMKIRQFFKEKNVTCDGFFNVSIQFHPIKRMSAYSNMNMGIKFIIVHSAIFGLSFDEIMKCKHLENQLCIAIGTLKPDYNLQETISNMEIIVGSYMGFIDRTKTSIKISYSEYSSLWMPLCWYMDLLLKQITEKVIPYIVEQYNQKALSIFNKKSDKYIKMRQLIKDSSNLYKEHVKKPTLEECNNLSTANTIKCKDFMTQLSYYSSKFNMITTKLIEL